MTNIVVSTSGTGGLAKHATITPEIMAIRIATTDKSNGKNIANCKVIFIGSAEMSSSYQRYKAWATARGKKTVNNVSADKIVETFKKENVDCLIGTPGFLKLVAQLFEATGQSAGLKQVVSGHAKLSRADGHYIQQWLGKNLQVGYGSTEIGTICSGTFEEVSDIEGCVGKPLEEVTVEIVDGDVIRIKATTMLTEYNNNPKADSIYFRDGWFYPGDKGYFTKDGRLVITKNR